MIDDHNAVTAGQAIEVVGAGPAGLAAAITLARTGRQVIVHEAHEEVGYRFQGDLQGLENWGTEGDVLSELGELGLALDCDAKPFCQGMAYDAWGRAYEVNNVEPLFYLIERGPGETTLDSALLRQARKLGVEIKFNSRLERLDGAGILAAGPKVADAIAVGYHFKTDMQDGFWVICDDYLAPQGYAYLLVMSGRGTVKTCMFFGFKEEKLYVQRTVEAFQKYAGLQMKNPVPHGGAGNFRIPRSAYSGRHPLVGEQAGFQDTLWGFGMRLAMMSGVLAANSLLSGENYDSLWQRELRPQMQNSVINRALYGMLGNRGYRWFLGRWTRKADIRHGLFSIYRPFLFKQWLLPWAMGRHESRRKDVSCNHVDCHCVWCRSGCAV